MGYSNINKSKIAFVLSIFITIVIIFSEFNYHSQNYLNDKIEDLTLQYNQNIQSNKQTVKALLDHIIEDSNTQNIIENGNNNIDKDTQRKKLLSIYNKEYQRMKNVGILQFHFHLANGESFLRFHKQNKFGDSLLFRKSINMIIKKKKEIYGFEVGRYFEGFRYIYPIFKDKKYIGSVEVAFETKYLLKQIKSNINYDFSMIIKSKLLNDRVEKEYIKSNYSKFDVNENYYIANILNNGIISKKSFQKVSNELNSKIGSQKSFITSVYDNNGSINILTFTPFYDINKENIGYIFSIKQDNTIHNIGMFHIFKFIIAFLIIILLYWLYLKMKEKAFETEQLQLAIDKTTLISKASINGKITYVSDAFCKVSGYSKDELVGKSHNIIRDESMSKDVFQKMWSEINSKKIWNGIVTNRKKDGSQYIVNATILPLLDNNQNIKEFIAIRHDITKLENYKKLLKNKLDKYSGIVNEYVIISNTDLKGYITFVSEAFCQVSGYTKDELVGSNHNIVRHKDVDKKVYKDLWNTVKKGNVWKGEIKNRKKDGGHYWVYAIVSPIFDENNKITGYTAVRQDITDKKIIEEISQKDKLTQIYNRVKLDEVLSAEIERNRRYQVDFSVILLDIDKFKSVNDNYGHNVGDIILKQTANLLNNSLRKTDTLGRWGGEEFLIICTNTELEGAFNLAEHLREKMEQFEFDHIGRVTASFGVAIYNKDETEEILLKRCDEALYQAKKNGRNRVEKK